MYYEIAANKIGDEGVKAIVCKLKNNNTLTKLRMGFNKFITNVVYNSTDVKCIKAIAEMLKYNRALVSLSLCNIQNCLKIVDHNKIGDEDIVIAISKALEENFTLNKLTLRKNILSI